MENQPQEALISASFKHKRKQEQYFKKHKGKTQGRAKAGTTKKSYKRIIKAR